jgi:FkbM family methyltransferase
MKLTFEIAQNTEIGRLLLSGQTYEAEVVELLKMLIFEQEQKSCFIDVGSNIGFFPLLVTQYAESNNLVVDVYAHEPSPKIVEIARELMRVNGLTYHLDPRAVLDRAGQVKFYLSAKSDASNSLNSRFRRHSGEIIVESCTLDDIYLTALGESKNWNVVLMIDVESLEPKVLCGGSKFISRFRPAIICEVLAGRTEQDLEKVFVDINYDYFRFDGYCWQREVSIFGDPNYIFRDWLFLPKERATAPQFRASKIIRY